METYEKSKGAAGDSGQKYEVEMLTVVYLRCLDTGEPFKLASNYSDAGKFDDIFVARTENLPRTCVQLKLRGRAITASEVFDFNGKFSIIEHFRSYRDKVKPKLGEHCVLILYTNAEMPNDLCKPQRTQSFLSTSKTGYFVTFTTGDVDVYNFPNNIRDYKGFLENILKDMTEVSQEGHASTIEICLNDFSHLKDKFPFSQKLTSLRKSPTKHLVESLIREVEKLGDLSLYYEFLEKFEVYYMQANESMLVEVIKQEVEKQTGVKVSNDIVTALIERIRIWWRNDEAYFLTQNDKIWFETVKDVFWKLSESKVSQVNNLNICFKSAIIKELMDTITQTKFVHILVDGDCTLLALCKVYHALGENSIYKDVIMDISAAVNQRDSFLGVLKSRWGHVLVLEAPRTKSIDVNEFFSVLSEVLQHNPYKRFIVITDVNDKATTKHVRELKTVSFNEYTDNTTLADLTEDTQNRLLNNTVIFQGYEVTLGKLIGNNKEMKRSVNEDVLMKLLKMDNVSIGGELMKPIDYYIPRTITRNSQSFIAERPKDIVDRAVVIIGDPGMGKSTLITKLGQVIKQKDPYIWVVRIELSEYTSYFDSITKPVIDKTIYKFLKKVVKFSATYNMGLHDCLFKHCWKTAGRMILLIDGFDEICPYYETCVSSIIENLLLTEINKIWITSRLMCKSTLEKITDSQALILDSFKENEQTVFLHTVWSKKFTEMNDTDLNNFISSILDVVSKSLNDVEKTFTGIPLQTMFIAEIFEDNLREYQRSEMITLPVHVDILEMYEAFFKKKSTIEVKGKKGFDLTKNGVNDIYTSIVKEADEIHKLCSLVTLLPHYQLKGLHDKNIAARVTGFLKDPHKYDLGVVHSVADGKPVFIHRTFAEYFMAKWFSENYHSNKHLLIQLLHENTFYMVIGLMNRFLAKNFKLHKAVINNDIKTFKTLLGTEDLEKKDYGGRTALHLAAGFSNNDEFTKLLLKRQVKVNIPDGMLSWTALRYADINKMWGSIELLLATGEVNASELIYTMVRIKNKDLITPTMRVCCEGGYENCLSFLIKAGVSANVPLDDQNYRPLHITSKHGEITLKKDEDSGKTERIIDLLLKYGADINATTVSGETPLHVAAEVGKLGIVMYLIERRMDETKEMKLRGTRRLMNVLNGKTETIMLQKVMTKNRNKDGKTALDVAAGRGYEHIVRYLTNTRCSIDGSLSTQHRLVNDPKLFSTIRFLVEERDADIHTVDGHNRTPLHYAAEVTDVSIVDYFIRKGAIPYLGDENGRTPLHIAAANGKVDIVKYLLEEVKMDPNAVGEDGRTAVEYALAGSHIEVARTLVALGDKVYVCSSREYTVLSDMCRRGNIDAVRYMIEECGTPPYEIGSYNRTPLGYACEDGHIAVVKYLVSRGALTSSQVPNWDYFLHFAAQSGKLEIVKFLIEECRQDPNALNELSHTPLHIACTRGFSDVVKYLISRGAKPDIRDEKNYTPLHFSAESGKLEIVKYLIEECRQDPNVRNELSLTPLHIACENGFIDEVDYLISRGADPDIRDQENYTPLHFAAQSGKLEIVKYLIENCRQDPNIHNDLSRTPLHIACASGFVDVVKYLISIGAQPDVRDEQNYTPLHFAANSGKLEVVKYLIEECRQEPNVRGGLSCTPLYMASYNDFRDVVEYLISLGADTDVRN